MKTKLKDNKIFRWIIIPICIALCFFGRFIPLFNGVPKEIAEHMSIPDANGVVFIFIGSLILWLTIGIDWPSLLCICALAFLPKIGFTNALSNSFGNSTFIFLLFTFICTYALSKTSFIKRIAIGFVNNKLAKKNGNAFIFLFLFAVLLIGLFISPSVLFVVILPILEEIFSLAGITKEDKVSNILMMGLGFTVSISSGMTPIAHVFPVLALTAAGVSEFPTLQYMLVAIPIGLVTFLAMMFIFLIIVRPDVSKLKNVDVSEIKNNLPKIDKKDIITLVIFIVVILLWVVPSLFQNILPDFYKVFNNFGTAMPPIIGTLLLCIIRVDDKPLIKIDEGFKNVPWGSLVMCAATLVLGVALGNKSFGATIGISYFLQNVLGSSLSNFAPILLLIIFGVWAAIQTNLSSNMVTATLVATVSTTVIASSGVSLNPIAVACIIGLLASFAFATPPSMPHIAIVAGSEYSSTKQVLLYGSILMIISVVAALAIGYPLWSLF